MAEIHLTAMSNAAGPSIPATLSAWLGEMTWTGGGAVSVLWLGIGDCAIRVWPADARRIRELGEKLVVLAGELEAKEPGACARADERS